LFFIWASKDIRPLYRRQLNINDLWHRKILGPEPAACVGSLGAINLISGFQRYETAIENKLYRALSQLERLQRMRKAEFVSAPESIDVAIHSRPEGEA
jgi:hypothetical protein